jgi:hypothetical protein
MSTSIFGSIQEAQRRSSPARGTRVRVDAIVMKLILLKHFQRGAYKTSCTCYQMIFALPLINHELMDHQKNQ